MCLHLLMGGTAGRGWFFADAGSGCRKAVPNYRGIFGNFVGRFKAVEDPIEVQADSTFTMIVFCISLSIIFFYGLSYV